MVRFSDTIAALATPVGTSALAVVRASGPECALLAKSILGLTPAARTAHHGDYLDKAGKLIDDVVATYFVAPHSYTGEDILEISSHGNPFIAQKILEDLLARGCRAAEAGEFTKRAFVNGRLDLSQAEAVMDLIGARSDRALEAANQQLRGSLGRHLEELTDGLLATLARVEAYIDFPDEDLPPEDQALVQQSAEQVLRGTERLLATQHYGSLLRDGLKTVIIGEPNAGKSSLLNRLLGHERALVSPEPGTTRDFLEERIIIGPHCIRLIDTAGLNATPGPLERKGIEKTLERAAEADLFLFVVDLTRPLPKLPPEVEAQLTPSQTIIIGNKVDLPLPHPADIELGLRFAGHPIIKISAVTGLGIDELTSAIVSRADAFRPQLGEETIAINARHADALVRAQASLKSALAQLREKGPVELLASDLRGTLEALGEIGGKIDNERMLDQLFANFCIGK